MGLDGNSEGGPNRALFLGLTRKSKSPPADDDVGDRSTGLANRCKSQGVREIAGEGSLPWEKENGETGQTPGGRGGFYPRKNI